MAQCPGCNKFPALETGDPEAEDVEVNEGSVSVSVRLVRMSECCGEEMKEYNFELESDWDPACKHDVDCYEADDPDWDVTERMQDKDRHGRPIKHFRYRKTFIGISGSVTLTCSECQKEVVVDMAYEVPASAFEELT